MTIEVLRTDFVGIPVTHRQRAVLHHRHAPYADGSTP